MAVKIDFDTEYNPQPPTIVLATRYSEKLGVLPAYNIIFKDGSYSELAFKINKYDNGKEFWLWDKVKDLKLVWCKEWDIWFEINVEINEENNLVKNITAKSLGESELSQIMIYSTEINTEDDIARDDYELPTVFYNPEHPEASLLHRIMEKSPHYSVVYVDKSLANIQRTFSFDNISIYDAFQKIAEEIECKFVINSGSNEYGKISRTISVYDLKSYCNDCKERGVFLEKCSKCGSENISQGYGKDTTIYISCDNLATGIVYSTDVDSVKNCFKLESGDDLMNAYYDTIDLSNYLKSVLMPNATISDTSATKEAEYLTAANFGTVSVNDLKIATSATVDNAVLAMAKVLIDTRYQVKIKNSTYLAYKWTGNFVVTNYSDDKDTAESSEISITISDDYETFVKQKIEKYLNKNETADLSISGLFKKEQAEFCSEIKKYCLDSLISFMDACQGCIDILIEQDISNGKTWSGKDPNLYDDLYVPYYNKLKALESEISLRQKEIETILGNDNNDETTFGLQDYIIDEVNNIQKKLNIEDYLGKELCLEFCSYRRESEYSNDNFISDGLNNAELFKRALEFLELANEEIYKSSELQHSISATLNNLLVMKEFTPIVDFFEIGNWIRICVNGEIYRLRLLEYEIDYDDLSNIQVEFSDVIKLYNGFSDIKSVLSQASTMATSYDYVKKQATQGGEAGEKLNDWGKNGLDTSNVKIVSGQTQTWDEHGMLFRKYNDITGIYDDTQLKIINSTITITDDNWKSTKIALGNFVYKDPVTGKLTYAYGLNAEVLIGKLILGESLGIYSENNTLTFDRNGLVVTNGINSFKVNPNNSNLFVLSNDSGDILWADDKGGLHIIGDGSQLDITMNNSVENMSSKITANEEAITSEVNRATESETQINGHIETVSENLSSRITQNANSITSEVTRATNAESSLSSRITQNANSISSKVSQGEIGTLITQNAEAVRIAWNNCSNYIEFSDGNLNIYNSSTHTINSKLMEMRSDGAWYYRDGSTIGKIGTNSWSNNNSHKGLVFDLESSAKYMCWAQRESSTGDYTVVLTYARANSICGEKEGIHFGCATYSDGYLYTSNNVKLSAYQNGDGGLSSESGNIIISTGNNVVVYSPEKTSSYSDIDLNKCNILNQSDARLKANISDTKINALSLISKIELKEFDWIEDNSHEEIGIIAQQLQKYIPSLVYEDSITGKLSIKENKFIPYIIKAIQELYSMVNSNRTKTISTLSTMKNDSWADEYSNTEKEEFVQFILSLKPDRKNEYVKEPYTFKM